MSIVLLSMHDLETRIQQLERLQKQQIAELKDSASHIVESISPAHLLKSALKDVVQSPDLRNSAINTAIGIGVGILGKKIYVGNSKNIFKKIAGTAVQFLIANLVRKCIPVMAETDSERGHEYEVKMI